MLDGGSLDANVGGLVALGSKAEAEKAAPEPEKKKRKVIVRKVIVKKQSRPEATAPAPVPEADVAAAASGSSETHEAPSAPATLEATQTIPATLQESEAPKPAVWAGWDRYRVQRHFDRPGIPLTKTPSAPTAVSEPPPSLAAAPPSEGTLVPSDPNTVGGAEDATILDGLEEELGEIMDAMEAESNTPTPAAATATTDSARLASQWHPAHDLMEYGKSLKAWFAALPEPATQKLFESFRSDGLLPEYEGIFGKLPEMDPEWVDHWVNFPCWKITQHRRMQLGCWIQRWATLATNARNKHLASRHAPNNARHSAGGGTNTPGS